LDGVGWLLLKSIVCITPLVSEKSGCAGWGYTVGKSATACADVVFHWAKIRLNLPRSCSFEPIDRTPRELSVSADAVTEPIKRKVYFIKKQL